MLLRSYFIPVARRLQRLSFHSSAVRRQDSPNHYETLEIPTNASHKDVKKSFYKLSKTHHPDRNPNDPSASQRFVKLSEAYAILSDPSKRQTYDRTHPHLHPSSRPPQSPPHHGSYSSSGPAGGRAPSGLSRRRSQFRGPPPSFYRSGGWGEHGAKRAAAHESSTAGAGAGASTSGAGRAPGMGPGEHPLGRGAEEDVPHFDRERHFRTHESQELRRRQRRSGRSGGFVPGDDVGGTGGYLLNFLFVGGIITLGIFVPSFLYETVVRDPKRRENDMRKL